MMTTQEALAGETGSLFKFQKQTGNAAKYFNVIGMVALVVLMLIMAVDATLRYVFSAPIEGAMEIAEFSLVILVFSGMAYASVNEEHVRVTILYGRLQDGTKAVLRSITNLLTVILLAFIVWQTVLRAGRSWEGQEETAGLFIPIAPFMLFVALGSAVWLLVILNDFLRSSHEALSGEHRRTRIGLAIGVVLTFLFIGVLAGHMLPWRIDAVTAGILGFALIIPVLLTGMSVGFVLMLLGVLGLTVLGQAGTAIIPLGQVPFTEASGYSMAVIPLFVLMGEVVYFSGLGEGLFTSAHKWLGSLPGGLASATIGASAGFASVCGSTVATAVTMSTVALPEMKRYGYQPILATGSTAAGGIIGTMIPPSMAFIFYGILVEQSIGRLFLAGIVPGILMSVLFIVSITIRSKLNPKLGPAVPGVSFKEKLIALKGVWAILALFLLVMGTIYGGVVTATEAGGLGAFGAVAIALILRRLTVKKFMNSLQTTMGITCMCILLFIGATIFGNFVALSRLPFIMATFITEAGLSPLLVMVLILFVFLVLGCVMPSYPVMILIVPIVFPAVVALGFDPIWFGVMMVLMTEIGALTPPVGIDVYAVAGVAKDVPMTTIFRGVTPFVVMLIILAAILVAFPQIALFLPELMKG